MAGQDDEKKESDYGETIRAKLEERTKIKVPKTYRIPPPRKKSNRI